MEVYEISVKILTPYITLVFLLSLMVNMAPHPIYYGEVGARVGGFWEDLFGSSETTESPPTSTSTSDDINSRIFLEITGIGGESLEESHTGWIEVQSFTMGMSKPDSTTTTTRSRGEIVIEDIVIVKELDKSSPKLMEKCANAQVIPDMVIEFCREIDTSLQTVYRYELSNVLITSFYCTGEAGTYAPVEEFSLNYEEITVIYTEYDETGKSKGNVEFTWKVEEAEA